MPTSGFLTSGLVTSAASADPPPKALKPKKAKIAEDKMQIEEKEYFMKEFRKIIEKQESARMGGHRKIMAGISAIR